MTNKMRLWVLGLCGAHAWPLAGCVAEPVDCESPDSDLSEEEIALACDGEAVQSKAQLGNNRGNQGRNHSH